jgi:hypothetical protein
MKTFAYRTGRDPLRLRRVIQTRSTRKGPIIIGICNPAIRSIPVPVFVDTAGRVDDSNTYAGTGGPGGHMAAATKKKKK